MSALAKYEELKRAGRLTYAIISDTFVTPGKHFVLLYHKCNLAPTRGDGDTAEAAFLNAIANFEKGAPSKSAAPIKVEAKRELPPVVEIDDLDDLLG
jgi:hypothetical protein